MTQKWYEKATVQSALVNSIPALLAALVGIIGLGLTWYLSNKQLEQAFDLYKQQMHRDSILNTQQSKLTVAQLDLNKKELDLVAIQTKQDSVNLSIIKSQNEILNNDRSFQVIQNKNKLLDLKQQLFDAYESIYKLTRNDTSVCKIMPMKNAKGQIVSNYLNYDFKNCPSETQNKWAKDILLVLKEGLKNPNLYKDKEMLEKWNVLINDMEWVEMSSDEGHRNLGDKETFAYFFNRTISFHYIDLISIINKHMKDK